MKSNVKTLKFSFAIALILTVVFSVNIFAVSTSNIALVKSNDTSYIIYVENMQDTFKYMITEENIEPTEFDVSSLDANGNNVATLNISDFTDASSLYLWIKDSDNNITNAAIDLTDYIGHDELLDMNTITKRISVDTDETKITETDENGKDVTVTVGKAVITDDSDKSYEYCLIKEDSNEDAKELNEKIDLINSFDENTDMYKVVSTYKDLLRLYKKIYGESEFEKVENMEIIQPEDAKDGEKYILVLKKLDGDDEVASDIQILTSKRHFDEGVNQIVEKETVQKPVKLPVTGDNILLISGFVLLIFALALLLVLKKKVAKENV